MSIRNSHIAELFYSFIEKSILPKLSKTFSHPNHFSLLGLGLALLVPPGFYLHPLVGLLFMVLSGISDMMDGLLARKKGMETPFGAFLDSSLDRCSDFCFLLGFWILFRHSENFIQASVLIFTAMFLVQFISYIKARAQSMWVECDTGLMERGARTVYLMVWAALLGIFPSFYHSILWSGLILFCLLCLFTVFQRFQHIAASLK
ncbi:MAG: CDP-alcohol phosphatidyltransferase family protein [Proteobacteria bacterium]|nr:CDP-alcohol phosphatidyltransferase family protein [Pseudomonadota bacterium]MBU4468932.1 CDP-alcohol phosphatidyltransferase family protein [Pseudomonadota bacterium]MCG2751168.1 CDP-alcohol phosphatidyltransferase family protein [Desulfobacteraceae bacterium]